jgi:hypothetical protein
MVRVLSCCTGPGDEACVRVVYHDQEFVLCYLDGKTCRQVELNLKLDELEHITFFFTGTGKVDLIG